MNVFDGYLPVIAIIALVLLVLYYARAFYYQSPGNRLKWHHLNEDNLPLPTAPQPVNRLKVTKSDLDHQTDTLELDSNNLSIKTGRDETVQKINLNNIQKVTAGEPGVLWVYLKGADGKFSSVTDGTIRLDFRQSIAGSLLWRYGLFNVSQTLPLKSLAFTAQDLIRADKTALALYYNVTRLI
jgi:hypothetical protein